MPTNALVKFDSQELSVLDEVAEECSLAVHEAGNNISGALAVAERMQQLRSLITPQMLNAVSALQNTAIGFMTDRGSTGKTYSAEELRDPFIEATVRGFRAVGNEFNIISGRFYGAKAGFERKVKTFSGLTDFSAMYDIEENANGTAKVQCIATWLMNGEPDSFERRKGKVKGQVFDNRIAVRVNSGMGHDAVIGKAQRKFYAAIYDYLIGAVVATPEGEMDDAPLPTSRRIAKSSIFDAASESNGNGNGHGDEPDENAPQPAEITNYRRKLAGIGQKTEIGGIAREAGQDKLLTKASRATIMQLCSEATKIWPNKIDNGFTGEYDPPNGDVVDASYTVDGKHVPMEQPKDATPANGNGGATETKPAPATRTMERTKEAADGFNPVAWADAFIEQIPATVRAKSRREAADVLLANAEKLGEAQYERCKKEATKAGWIL